MAVKFSPIAKRRKYQSVGLRNLGSYWVAHCGDVNLTGPAIAVPCQPHVGLLWQHVATPHWVWCCVAGGTTNRLRPHGNRAVEPPSSPSDSCDERCTTRNNDFPLLVGQSTVCTLSRGTVRASLSRVGRSYRRDELTVALLQSPYCLVGVCLSVAGFGSPFRPQVGLFARVLTWLARYCCQ